MTIIKADTILRSRNAANSENVLSSFLLTYPRWIHAEQRTHRVIPLDESLTFEEPTPSLMACEDLSRNASSSRALPVRKMIEDVRTNPAIPLWWGKNMKGMQAWEELTGQALIDTKAAYMRGLEAAIKLAEELADLGAHKQIVNRVLEPYSHIRVLVSATEWQNYLELRDHPAAEPHIHMLSEAIREQLGREETIQLLQPGEWHTPFVGEEDRLALTAYRMGDGEEMRRACSTSGASVDTEYGIQRDLIKLSVARCASTSYKTVDGFDMTMERAIKLHDNLLVSKPMHASPGEHVAKADSLVLPKDVASNVTEDVWAHPKQHGNFVGFRQYRHMVPLLNA